MDVELLHSGVHWTHIHGGQDPLWRTAHRDEWDEIVQKLHRLRRLARLSGG
jgi:hypothetical protein